MNNFLKKYKVENINVGQIDTDSFGEGLLVCAAKTKSNCADIDTQLYNVARIPFLPLTWGINTMEHYEVAIELMTTKSKLLVLYDAFVNWYKGLTTQQKKLYIAYFVKRDKTLCNALYEHYQRYVTAMSKNFMRYVKINNNLNMEEMIKNPFIHDEYMRIKMRKEHNKKFKEEGRERDSSTNEGRNR